MRKELMAIGMAIMLVMTFMPTSVAQAELPDPGITPDSWLYGLDRAFESLQKAITRAPEARAKLALQLAQERLVEAREMAERGKPDLANEMAEDYEEELNQAMEHGEKIAELAKRGEVQELVAGATSIHIDVLEGVLEKVPEQARPAIQRAINASKGGREISLDGLGEIKPEEAAKLRFEFAEKRLLKARERAEEGDIEIAEDLVEEYEEEVHKSLEMTNKAREAGKDVTELVELVANATSKHLLVLEEVHEKAPDAAKPAIEIAMNVSARGQEEALKALMKTSPERAEEIEREMPEDVRTIRERVNITPEAMPSPSPSPSPTGANETEGRGG